MCTTLVARGQSMKIERHPKCQEEDEKKRQQQHQQYRAGLCDSHTKMLRRKWRMTNSKKKKKKMKERKKKEPVNRQTNSCEYKRSLVLRAALLFLFDSFPFFLYLSRIQTHRYLANIYVEHLHMTSWCALHCNAYKQFAIPPFGPKWQTFHLFYSYCANAWK